jgi:hypothetical protein
MLMARFREHIRPGGILRVRGWIAENGRRLVKTEAFLQNISGKELAHAWATFLFVK